MFNRFSVDSLSACKYKAKSGTLETTQKQTHGGKCTTLNYKDNSIFIPQEDEADWAIANHIFKAFESFTLSII